MALSRITINHSNISAHLQASPLGGTSARTRRGAGGREAIQIAARMALLARINAAERFDQRTTALVTSVVPIVREGRGGDVEVGVGTTVEHGKWLEVGTDFHFIPPKAGRFLQDNPSSPRRPQRDEWVLQRRSYRPLPHPGNEARHWMSDAVRQVIPGARVRVRELK